MIWYEFEYFSFLIIAVLFRDKEMPKKTFSQFS